jgi:nucleotide-binding universal stress UspA family protein
MKGEYLMSDTVNKCLMLPIDITEESLKPIDFVVRLYPSLQNINLVLCYLLPPLPPVYREKAESPAILKRRRELLSTREKEMRTAFSRARDVLTRAGFDRELIQEHVQDREISVARHTCLLANIKKVDAVLLQKRVSSSIEGFLKDDPTSEMLRHCLTSPIWLIDGNIDPSTVAVCIQHEEASLRIADHISFMLAETGARFVLLHVSRAASKAMFGEADHPGEELRNWFGTSAGMEIEPYLDESVTIARNAGIDGSRIRMGVLPGRGNTAMEILSYCRENRIGMVALGHSPPAGTWGFLRGSVTKQIMAEFLNMAVFISQ